MREDFGFKHLLWVYSGRRGIHLWISDKEAFELADESRRALVGWIEVIKGSGKTTKKVDGGYIHPVFGRTLHPTLRRAIGDDHNSGPLKDAFVRTILEDQNCFRERKHWEILLDLLPQASGEIEIVNRLRNKWEKDPTRKSLDKWGDIVGEVQKLKPERAQNVWKPHLEDVILQYTYPRVDSEVSKKMNHLLKSPFVVHPSTGNVCVPLDVEMIQNFDPMKDCPTVGQLLREFNRNGKDESGAKSKGMEWDKTSLKPYVEILDRYCQGIIRQEKAFKKGESMKVQKRPLTNLC